jgi:uncharacterized coiled-coil DUF342 family protein
MSDIVERLRDPSRGSPRWSDTMDKAADEIERLRKDNADILATVTEGWDQARKRQDQVHNLEAEIERLRRGCTMLNSEVCQRLGKALGYPWFKDDQENFPGATEESGVCTGEHVAESIAAEAATRIERLEARLAWWDNASREMYEALNKAEAERDEAIQRGNDWCDQAQKARAERDAAVMDADMQAREAGNMEHNARVLMAERDRLREALDGVMNSHGEQLHDAFAVARAAVKEAGRE